MPSFAATEITCPASIALSFTENCCVTNSCRSGAASAPVTAAYLLAPDTLSPSCAVRPLKALHILSNRSIRDLHPYRSGSRSLTSRVYRVNSGSNWLSNRSCRSLARGRRTVTVPLLIVSRRGLPYPFRYPCMSTRGADAWRAPGIRSPPRPATAASIPGCGLWSTPPTRPMPALMPPALSWLSCPWRCSSLGLFTLEDT